MECVGNNMYCGFLATSQLPFKVLSRLTNKICFGILKEYLLIQITSLIHFTVISRGVKIYSADSAGVDLRLLFH